MDKPEKETPEQFTWRVNDELRKPTYDRLRIECAKYALSGLLAHHGSRLAPEDAARMAFEHANAMVRRAKNYDEFYQRNGMGGE